MKKQLIFIILVLIVGAGFVFYDRINPSVGAIGVEAARVRAEKFVNENLVSPGLKASIKEVTEEYNLYKILVEFNGNEIPTYLTKDGKKFFPSVMDIEEIEEQNEQSKKAAEIPKNDKPEVELFVMSYCPYGTQAEKGIIPAIEALGSKINFTLKFVDYIMHGDKEINENLRQYCIQKEEPAKLLSYLDCFLKDGDNADACIKSVGVDAAKINRCINSTDKEFQITEKAKDESTWVNGRYPVFEVDKADTAKYGVQGSPDLIINGVSSVSDRDAASLLSAICSGFNNEPEECNQELSAQVPSAGFGEEIASSDSSGGDCAQ